MAQVSAGDAFTAPERHEIDKAIRDAETVCRYEFSVYVGASEGETGPFAHRLHSTLTAPDRTVLVMVDPAARILEIVTGPRCAATSTTARCGWPPCRCRPPSPPATWSVASSRAC